MRAPRGLFVSASIVLLAAAGTASPTASAAPQPRTDSAETDPATAATVVVAEIDAAATVVRHMLQVARAQRDVIKITRLNDKLTQLDVAVRAALELKGSLLAAAAHGDAAAVAVERARLEVRREVGRRLAAEAHQCIGNPDPAAHEEGHTSMTAPPLPSPAEYPAPEDVFANIQPPVPVSPYK